MLACADFTSVTRFITVEYLNPVTLWNATDLGDGVIPSPNQFNAAKRRGRRKKATLTFDKCNLIFCFHKALTAATFKWTIEHLTMELFMERR